jgi:hypothetical protein
MSVDAQRGHESCAGNVTIPHWPQRLPSSCGSSLGQVKRPSATGTCVIRGGWHDMVYEGMPGILCGLIAAAILSTASKPAVGRAPLLAREQ